MKCELTVLKGLKRKLDIVLSEQQVQSSFDISYNNKKKTVKLPGFREGKIPISHIRSMYPEEIKQDTTIHLINKFYLQALQEHKLQPASDPQITPKSPIVEGKNFEFSVTVEVQPTVNVSKDFTVTLSKPSVKVEDTDIQKTLDNIKGSSATFTLVETPRGIVWGDIVELQIKEISESIGIEKQPLLEVNKNHDLEITGLIEALPDMKVKDTKTLTVNLSKNYPVEEHKNKEATIEVTVLAIKNRILPELNQEFFNKFKCKDLTELKTLIRGHLQQQKEEEAYNSMKEATLKQITDKHTIAELPESVVENQKKYIIDSVKQRLEKSKAPKTEIQKYEQKFQKEFEKQALFIVKSSYLIYALASKLDISASPEEIKKHIKNDTPKNAYNEEYEKTKNFIIREKTLNHLITEALKSNP